MGTGAMWGIARWVLFLPAAFAAYWATYLVLTVLNRLMMTMSFYDADGFLARAYIETLSSTISACAFVIAGAKTSPAAQTKVGFGLIALGLVLSGGFLFFAVWVQNYWAVWSSLCTSAGLIITAVAVQRGEISLSK